MLFHHARSICWIEAFSIVQRFFVECWKVGHDVEEVCRLAVTRRRNALNVKCLNISGSQGEAAFGVWNAMRLLPGMKRRPDESYRFTSLEIVLDFWIFEIGMIPVLHWTCDQVLAWHKVLQLQPLQEWDHVGWRLDQKKAWQESLTDLGEWVMWCPLMEELLDDYADHSEKARSVHHFPFKGKARSLA